MRGHLRSVIHAARQTAHGCALRLVLWEKLKGRRVDGRQGAGDNPIERTPSIHSILHLFPFTLRLDSPISLSLFHLSDHLSLLLLTGRERKAQIKGRLHPRGQQEKEKPLLSIDYYDGQVNCCLI